MSRRLRVLFVSTGNGARSLLGEAILRQSGGDAFEAHSAGTHPGGVHPLTHRVLAEAGIPSAGLRSKGLEEYAGESFDYVITLCDDARLICPVFPGVQEAIHWGYDNPGRATASEGEQLAAFRTTTTALAERIRQFTTIARRVA